MQPALTSLVPMNEQTIWEAARAISTGGLVAYPTDTVYGLGCDPFNSKAVQRLVVAKKRESGALPVLVDTVQRTKGLAWFNKSASQLAEHFWPGPLTIVAKAKVTLPAALTASSGFVGLRMPRHPGTLTLIEQCGGSLVGTSANISGNPPSVSAQEVSRQLGGLIDLILDGGPSTLGVESTVVKIDGEKVTVLREKAVPHEKIANHLKKLQTA